MPVVGASTLDIIHVHRTVSLYLKTCDCFVIKTCQYWVWTVSRRVLFFDNDSLIWNSCRGL